MQGTINGALGAGQPADALAKAGQRLGRRVKRRLLWTFIAFGVAASSTWYFREAVFRLLFAPAGGNLSPYGGLPIFASPSEMMGATIHLAMQGGLIAATPVATVSVYQLLRPLLSRKLRLFCTIFLPAAFVCYIGGAAFAYFVLLPVGLKFLLRFGNGLAVPLINVTEYMALVTAMLFWLGVVFELPLAMFLLTKLQLVSLKRFQQAHKYVPAAAFVLSAILTPTFDVFNQTMVAIPIVLLFEVGLFMSWLASPKLGFRTALQKIKAKVATLWRWALNILMVLPRMARRGWTRVTGGKRPTP